MHLIKRGWGCLIVSSLADLVCTSFHSVMYDLGSGGGSNLSCSPMFSCNWVSSPAYTASNSSSCSFTDSPDVPGSNSSQPSTVHSVNNLKKLISIHQQLHTNNAMLSYQVAVRGIEILWDAHWSYVHCSHMPNYLFSAHDFMLLQSFWHMIYICHRYLLSFLK